MTKTTAPMERLAAEASILLCCGSGGGRQDHDCSSGRPRGRPPRRAVVVTIDPAKRLVDTLGLGELTNTPSLIDDPVAG